MIHVLIAIICVMIYPAIGGVVMQRSRAYMFRLTDMSTDDAKSASIAAGVAWPLTVPWFVFARATGNIDPKVREDKAHALKLERLEHERAERAANALAQQEALNEDLAIRKRARLAGEEIAYTDEERLAIERAQIENDGARVRVEQERQKVNANRLAIERRREGNY